MVFARDAVEGSWKWGEDVLPNVLGISVMSHGMHI